MIISILPLIYDYLHNPFQLNQLNSTFSKYGKKYPLTFIYGGWGQINKNILKIYNWKNLQLYCGENITDDDLKLIPEIRILSLYKNLQITDNGLKYIPNIYKLNL